jgi:hypothetical protein
MPYQQNDDFDALLDAIYSGYRYDGAKMVEDETDAVLTDIFDCYRSSVTDSWNDVLFQVAYDVCAYRLAKFGDDPRDPHGERALAWFGQMFSDLVAFTLNENNA